MLVQEFHISCNHKGGDFVARLSQPNRDFPHKLMLYEHRSHLKYLMIRVLLL